MIEPLFPHFAIAGICGKRDDRFGIGSKHRQQWLELLPRTWSHILRGPTYNQNREASRVEVGHVGASTDHEEQANHMSDPPPLVWCDSDLQHVGLGIPGSV